MKKLKKLNFQLKDNTLENQQELGNLIELSKSMICEVENGHKSAKVEEAMILCELFNYSPTEYLLYDNPLTPDELDRLGVYLQIEKRKKNKGDEEYLKQVVDFVQSEYGENMRRYIRYMWPIYQLSMINPDLKVLKCIKQLTYAYINSEWENYYPTVPDDDKKTGTDD
ncbi:MAG: helix-turn-helix transcriptional regulator [Lachnospiraceae bacterium]|nr:helix-turn-helix transcriptional regulator [Lachnospiraceae bacterium]